MDERAMWMTGQCGRLRWTAVGFYVQCPREAVAIYRNGQDRLIPVCSGDIRGAEAEGLGFVYGIHSGHAEKR